MSGSNKAELLIFLHYDDEVRGYDKVHCDLREGEHVERVSAWDPYNGYMSRSKVVETVVRAVRQYRPSRVGFITGAREKYAYWSRETLRQVLNNQLDVKDLLIGG